MLILSRQVDEAIVISLQDVTPEDLDRLLAGEPIILTTVDIRGDKVRHGATAPRSVGVDRFEVWKSKRREAAEAKAAEAAALAE